MSDIAVTDSFAPSQVIQIGDQTYILPPNVRPDYAYTTEVNVASNGTLSQIIWTTKPAVIDFVSLITFQFVTGADVANRLPLIQLNPTQLIGQIQIAAATPQAANIQGQYVYSAGFASAYATGDASTVIAVYTQSIPLTPLFTGSTVRLVVRNGQVSDNAPTFIAITVVSVPTGPQEPLADTGLLATPLVL